MKRKILFRGKRKDNGEWVGERRGSIEILRYSRKTDKTKYFICRCDCGNIYEIDIQNFKRMPYCGCCKLCRNKRMKESHTTHGLSDTRIYTIWLHMIGRCEKPNNKDYKNYGARGISVCEKWHSFIEFNDWALQNGYSYILTIDRINVNGNYQPDNCRWSNFATQSNNRRNNIKYRVYGQTGTLRQICEKNGFNYELAKGRLKRGVDINNAVSLPKNKTGKRLILKENEI